MYMLHQFQDVSTLTKDSTTKQRLCSCSLFVLTILAIPSFLSMFMQSSWLVVCLFITGMVNLQHLCSASTNTSIYPSIIKLYNQTTGLGKLKSNWGGGRENGRKFQDTLHWNLCSLCHHTLLVGLVETCSKLNCLRTGRFQDPRWWGKRETYTAITRMICARRWAAMKSNQGPFPYHPNTLLLGQPYCGLLALKAHNY